MSQYNLNTGNKSSKSGRNQYRNPQFHTTDHLRALSISQTPAAPPAGGAAVCESFPKSWSTGNTVVQAQFPKSWSSGNTDVQSQFPKSWSTGNTVVQAQFPKSWSTGNTVVQSQFPKSWSSGNTDVQSQFPKSWQTDDAAVYESFPKLWSTANTSFCTSLEQSWSIGEPVDHKPLPESKSISEADVTQFKSPLSPHAVEFKPSVDSNQVVYAHLSEYLSVGAITCVSANKIKADMWYPESKNCDLCNGLYYSAGDDGCSKCNKLDKTIKQKINDKWNDPTQNESKRAIVIQKEQEQAAAIENLLAEQNDESAGLEINGALDQNVDNVGNDDDVVDADDVDDDIELDPEVMQTLFANPDW